MVPTEIDKFLQRDVIGQEESLQFVSVAIFKHLQGEPYGNLILIGSSGTGKTTIMRAVERLYEEHDELQKYRTVVIINANTFSSDEGEVDTTRLFTRLEELRQVADNAKIGVVEIGDEALAAREFLEFPTIRWRHDDIVGQLRANQGVDYGDLEVFAQRVDELLPSESE